MCIRRPLKPFSEVASDCIVNGFWFGGYLSRRGEYSVKMEHFHVGLEDGVNGFSEFVLFNEVISFSYVFYYLAVFKSVFEAECFFRVCYFFVCPCDSYQSLWLEQCVFKGGEMFDGGEVDRCGLCSF